jgi:YVTN family beta-propeller protein
MRSIIHTSVLVLCFVALTAGTAAMAADSASGQFKVLKKVPFEGGGRWDYVTVDPVSHRVYVALATHVLVVDSETGAVVGDIPDTKGVHGVTIVNGVGYITCGLENKVKVFDPKTLKVISEIETGGGPDSAMYHPATHLLFIENGKDNSSTVIDTMSKQVVATIALGGVPEHAVFDDRDNVFINLEDTGSIAVVDVASKKLKNTWKMAGCELPAGLAIDRGSHTLFSGCGNKMLEVVNSDTGQVLQTVPIGLDNDGVVFDPSTGYVFASNGDGKLSVLHRDKAGTYAVVQTVDLPPGSKTMNLDPKSHKLWVPSAQFTGDPSVRPRPQVVPGSFVLLVVGQ